MSSGPDASDRDAALALLSGPDLVAHLRVTCRRADYDAAARVLGDRDREHAETEAALAEARTGLADLTAEVQALQERYLELKAASRGPSSRSSGGAIAAAAPRVNRRAQEPAPNSAIDLCSSSDNDELEEGEFRPGVARVSRKRKAPASACSSDDDEIPLCQFIKKQGPVAGPEKDASVQVRTPSVTNTARTILGSARVVAETPMQHTDSSSDGTINVVLKSMEGQEKAIGVVHKTKVSLDTNGTGDKGSIVLKDTSEQRKPDGQVPHTKVLPRSDGIKEQGGKLSPFRSQVDAHGGRSTTSDKPVSATLQKNQLELHPEQMSVESSLSSAVTRHWKSASALLFSCLGNKELCMQAACALHRQKKFTTQPTGGITKFDADRAAELAEFLLDGNLQGPLKRTAEDLVKRDSTGHDLLERVVLQCSEQLFSIYRNKDDKYFR